LVVWLLSFSPSLPAGRCPLPRIRFPIPLSSSRAANTPHRFGSLRSPSRVKLPLLPQERKDSFPPSAPTGIVAGCPKKSSFPSASFPPQLARAIPPRSSPCSGRQNPSLCRIRLVRCDCPPTRTTYSRPGKLFRPSLSPSLRSGMLSIPKCGLFSTKDEASLHQNKEMFSPFLISRHPRVQLTPVKGRSLVTTNIVCRRASLKFRPQHLLHVLFPAKPWRTCPSFTSGNYPLFCKGCSCDGRVFFASPPKGPYQLPPLFLVVLLGCSLSPEAVARGV